MASPSLTVVLCRPRVPGQFVAGQFVADNSSRTIRRGQFVQNLKLIFIESSLLLPFQQHYFHQSRFRFSNIILITSASISASLFFITPASTSAIGLYFSSIPQFVADISSRTIRRGQFVQNLKLIFIESSLLL